MVVLTILITLCTAGTVPASASSLGTLRSWGDNSFGELGNGKSVTTSNKPVPVSHLQGVTSIAAGGSHALALIAYGTVMSWGDNESGQLGNGTRTNEKKPVAVSGLSGVKSIAAGGSFSLALLSNGTVMSWGDNSVGQLGNGSNVTYSTTPVAVTGLSGVTAIAAGVNHALALLSNGTVMAWGDNSSGELGNGTNGSFSNTPVAVTGLSGVTAIAAGDSFSECLVTGGDVMTWGNNASGQLGDGSMSNSDSPVSVVGLSSVSSIAAGGSFGLAVDTGGGVMAWGDNFYGELGNGTDTNSDTPTAVTGLSGISSISAGGANALAVKRGRVLAWGDNFYGELGTRSVGTSSDVPIQIKPRQVTTVSSGDPGGNQGFSMALFTNKTVETWGYDAYGQLGNGTVGVTSDNPVNVRRLTGVAAVSAGNAFTLALMGNGTVMSWGDNSVGQLGDGTASNDSNVPVAVKGLTGVTAVAAGFEHGLALLSNGTVMAWGDNSDGELGNGTTTNSDVPVAVTGLSGVSAVSAGGDDSLALLSNGTVVAWGDNSYGELGNGSTTNNNTPVAVTGLSGVTAVSAGLEHSLALVSGGGVMAWGNDNAGQLGDGSASGFSDTPVPVTGLAGSTVTAVSAGLDHSLGLLSNGTVVAWGDNGAGELGNASSVNSDTPVPVSDLDDAIAISAGSDFSLALTSTGHVSSWGLDATTESKVPVEVRGLARIIAISAGGDHSVAVKLPHPLATTLRHDAAGPARQRHISGVRTARSTVHRALKPTGARAGRHRRADR